MEGSTMRSEASKRADAKYKADKTTQVVIRFYPKDAELLAHLQKQESKQGYIKRLIANDMEGGWGDRTFFGMGFKECGEKLRRAKYELLPEWCKPPQEAVCRKCGYIATVGEAMVCDSCPKCGYSGKLLGSKVDIVVLDELHVWRGNTDGTDC